MVCHKKKKIDEVNLEGFTYADWAGDSTDKKSTLSCNFNVGSTVVS